MKYICMKRYDGPEEIITFPESIDHDCMAEALEGIKDQATGNWQRILRTPISAGFVTVDGTCFGKSHSLDLGSRDEEDTEILLKQHGI